MSEVTAGQSEASDGSETPHGPRTQTLVLWRAATVLNC